MHPNLHIDLRLTDHIVDLYKQRLDIAIRVGRLADSALVAKHLTTNYRILAASPLYLAEHVPLNHPRELVAHQCLLLSYPGYKKDKWTLIHKQYREQPQLVYPNALLSSDNGDALRQWCLLGKGIFLCEPWYVAEDIRAGQLIHILADWQEPASDISIIYQQQGRIPNRVTAFINYIAEYWRQPPWLS